MWIVGMDVIKWCYIYISLREQWCYIYTPHLESNASVIEGR